MPVPKLQCNKCSAFKPASLFHKHPRTRSGRQGHCKVCHKLMVGDRFKSDPRERLYRNSVRNAAEKGLAHSIHRSDIVLPTHCPYLGCPLDYSFDRPDGVRKENGATIDRVDSERGYEPGNVQIISDLANRMKTDATIDQLLAFAEGIIKRHRS